MRGMVRRAVPDTLAARVFRVDVGGAVIQAMVVDRGDHVEIPIQAQLPDGGWVRTLVQVDAQTFARAYETAVAKGLDAIRLSDMVERAFGVRPSVVEQRALPRRSGGYG